MGLKLEHVSYLYGTDTELLVRALDDVNLEIPDGQFIGLIGHTGSGKSTLVQHLNGLLKPSEGTILFNGENIWAQDYSRKTLRSKVGLVFSIRSISCLKRMYLRMSAMAPKTSGWSRGRSSGVQKRHWSWWVFRKNFSDSPRLSFPADKNGEWQLQVCLQWSRIFWCWMSRQQDLIRRAGTKY